MPLGETLSAAEVDPEGAETCSQSLTPLPTVGEKMLLEGGAGWCSSGVPQESNCNSPALPQILVICTRRLMQKTITQKNLLRTSTRVI